MQHIASNPVEEIRITSCQVYCCKNILLKS